ncbi:hypothetical protein SXCC_02700 [Gluconacetobacter sp. SXCC-1]|nr:hypothetical protein SXCC_02700 [Gluconacetobacter sp. SXCC-1]
MRDCSWAKIIVFVTERFYFPGGSNDWSVWIGSHYVRI